MEIRSHSESVSREGGEERRGGRVRARETDKREAAAAAIVNAPLCKQEKKARSHKPDDFKQ